MGPQFALRIFVSRPRGAERMAQPIQIGSAAPGRGPTLPGGAVMAIRPNSEERSFGADRERQREVSTESGRNARASNSDNAARGDQATDAGQSRSRSNRGFASMDRSKQREIASKGGRAA